MYQQCKSVDSNEIVPQCIKRLSDNAFIPFAPDNTDYAQFKVDLSEGVTLLDAEGVEMTPEQVQELLETLP
jgi:hypothetical protein